MYKYILFDFDGTIVNTNDLIILALNTTAKEFLGRELSREELNSILGKYLDDQMKQLRPDKYREMVNFYRSFYSANQDEMTKEFPGIRDMMIQLKTLGCETAVVSAKSRDGIEHGLHRFGLAEYIDVIVSAYDIQNNKPHPEPALKALKFLSASPSEALMVGDSPYDILCGKNAGIKTVLVDWTIFPKKPLFDLNPDYCVKNTNEIVKIVKFSAT